MGCPAKGLGNRDSNENADQHQHTNAEHRPVNGESGAGIDGAHWAQGAERRKNRRHCEGNHRAEDHGEKYANETLDNGGKGTCSEGPHYAPVLVAPA
jgi:hypothetical protein